MEDPTVKVEDRHFRRDRVYLSLSANFDIQSDDEHRSFGWHRGGQGLGALDWAIRRVVEDLVQDGSFVVLMNTGGRRSLSITHTTPEGEDEANKKLHDAFARANIVYVEKK